MQALSKVNPVTYGVDAIGQIPRGRVGLALAGGVLQPRLSRSATGHSFDRGIILARTGRDRRPRTADPNLPPVMQIALARRELGTRSVSRSRFGEEG